MIKVLIIDGHDRRSLAAVRSLGERVGEFDVIVGSSRRINSSRFSKYCNRFVLYPDPDKDEQISVGFLLDYIYKNKIQVLLPMGDCVAEIVSKYRDKFNKVTNVLVPNYDVFRIARDKGLTLQYAKKNNIPCPKTYHIEEIKEKTSVINYPIIIKPRISSAGVGLMVANNKEQAIEYYERVKRQYGSLIIQEMIPNIGEHYQANLLFDKNSELKASCIKKKIRQFPISGGPSTFFKTVANNEIEDLSIKLLKSINWVGPAEVEYMIDPRDGNPKLMEINPRLSATIRLSCFVGIDFPYLIVKNALGEETELIRNDKFDYYCQWFFPGDLMNLLFNKDRFKEKYGYIFNKPKNICHMTYDPKDKLPYFINIVALGISIFNLNKLRRFLNR